MEECYQDIERLAQQVNQLRIETLLSDSNDRLSCFLVRLSFGVTFHIDLSLYSRRKFKPEPVGPKVVIGLKSYCACTVAGLKVVSTKV